MRNNIIRRIKLIYKNSQRTNDPIEFIRAEFRKLGFQYAPYLSTRNYFLKQLNNLTSKERRAIFRVCRAVAKRGEVINLTEVLMLKERWALGTTNQSKEYVESLKNSRIGDLRLLSTVEQINGDRLFILNNGVFKFENGLFNFYPLGEETPLFHLNGLQTKVLKQKVFN